jgi:hypothetical protein
MRAPSLARFCAIQRFSSSSDSKAWRANPYLSWITQIASLLFFAAISAGFSAPPVGAQASVTGTWQTLPTTVPINPVHIALMHNGKLLIVSGSGNVANNPNWTAAVWDPQTNTVTTMAVGFDMFCNGMIVLPDGRPFVMGGTLQYDPFHGELKTSAFDQTTGTFTDQQLMAHGRWYPTGVVLGDGRAMVFSGLDENGGTNTSVEFYTVGAGWSQPFAAPWTPPLYPRLHLLPNSKVFYSGSTTGSHLFDPSTQTWTLNIAFTNFSGTRTYGSSILLPLTPANGYRPRVMIFGGGNPATNTTETIDLSATNPKWVTGIPMSQPRIEMNATILPNGKILATGGSTNDEDANTASLNADLYDSVSGNRTSAGANAFPRLYHSNSILLPDATVLLIGGNPQRGTYEPHLEIYSPAYLFNADGSLATRPTITSINSSTIGYTSAFQVQTPDAAAISSVVLMKAGAVTHAFDMEQRLVGLNFTAGNGVLNVTSPPNGNIAPPGYYLLFLLNSSGVPSVAQFVKVTTNPDEPPAGTITSPASNVNIVAGQSVNFAGSGSDPDGTITGYSWTFPGGAPATSVLANPGNVTYSSPSTFVASLTVTDSAGLTDPNPPTRTITVAPAFTLSATPASQNVVAGSNTSYALTVTPATGFTGLVSFSVSGLPTGASASFNPATVTTSGSTTMTVTTTGSTIAGTYPLTITGTSGSASSTAIAALNVAGGSSPKTITFVQSTFSTPNGSSSTVTATYPAGETTGDLNVVVVGWSNTTTTVSSVTDSDGNAYSLAAGPTVMNGLATQAIYYAPNIVPDADNTNTVTVTFNGSAPFPDLRILEYMNADPTNPLDAAAGASGTSSNSTVSLTTTSANDLVFGANYVQTSTSAAGPGFARRMITQPDGDIAEDELATKTGSNSASALLGQSGWWLMQAVAIRAAAGTPPPPDTTPPTTPGNLTASAISSTQINLSWSASTDDTAVTGYRVEQCANAGCSNFAQIAAPTGTTFNVTGLTASTSYSYRVRAVDTANLLSNYSNIATATTQSTPPPPTNISFVQANYTAPASSSGTTVSVAFTAAQSAGDLNIVAIGWFDTTSTISSVTDSSGNVYTPAATPITLSGTGTQAIYYAKNIAAAATNTMTVTFNHSVSFPDMRIVEYAGASITAPIDVTASNTGTGSTSSSGPLTTSNAKDMLFAANYVATSTISPGAGFTSRIITSPDGDIVEDQLVTATGTYTATASIGPSGGWLMQAVAIR